MDVILTLVFLAVFLFVVGRLQIRPRHVDPQDPAWNRFDEVPSAEAFGYVVMLVAGIFLAGAVAALTAVGFGDPGDPPVGALLVFAGSMGIWCWFYEGVYRRLRRAESPWAGVITTLGAAGKRIGPPVLIVGVGVTVAM